MPPDFRDPFTAPDPPPTTLAAVRAAQVPTFALTSGPAVTTSARTGSPGPGEAVRLFPLTGRLGRNSQAPVQLDVAPLRSPDVVPDLDAPGRNRSHASVGLQIRNHAFQVLDAKVHKNMSKFSSISRTGCPQAPYRTELDASGSSGTGRPGSAAAVHTPPVRIVITSRPGRYRSLSSSRHHGSRETGHPDMTPGRIDLPPGNGRGPGTLLHTHPHADPDAFSPRRDHGGTGHVAFRPQVLPTDPVCTIRSDRAETACRVAQPAFGLQVQGPHGGPVSSRSRGRIRQ